MKENKETSVAERLASIVEASGLSKSQFARTTGLSPQNVYDFISGRKGDPSYGVIKKILDTYPNINANWLFSGVGSMYIDASTAPIQEFTPLERWSDTEIISSYLRALRETQELSIQDAASQIGIEEAELAEVESGFILPTTSHLSKLAHLYKTDVSTILSMPDKWRKIDPKTGENYRVAELEKENQHLQQMLYEKENNSLKKLAQKVQQYIKIIKQVENKKEEHHHATDHMYMLGTDIQEHQKVILSYQTQLPAHNEKQEQLELINSNINREQIYLDKAKAQYDSLVPYIRRVEADLKNLNEQRVKLEDELDNLTSSSDSKFFLTNVTYDFLSLSGVYYWRHEGGDEMLFAEQINGTSTVYMALMGWGLFRLDRISLKNLAGIDSLTSESLDQIDLDKLPDIRESSELLFDAYSFDEHDLGRSAFETAKQLGLSRTTANRFQEFVMYPLAGSFPYATFTSKGMIWQVRAFKMTRATVLRHLKLLRDVDLLTFQASGPDAFLIQFNSAHLNLKKERLPRCFAQLFY